MFGASIDRAGASVGTPARALTQREGRPEGPALPGREDRGSSLAAAQPVASGASVAEVDVRPAEKTVVAALAE